MTGIQRTILENALPCLKPGGRIVYSTCSIEPEENHDLLADFVTIQPDLKIDAEHQALPYRNHTDGAYAARLIQVTAATRTPSEEGRVGLMRARAVEFGVGRVTQPSCRLSDFFRQSFVRFCPT